MKRNIGRLAAFVAVVGLGLWLANPKEIAQSLRQLTAWTIALCLAVEFGFFLVESWRMQWLSHGLYPMRVILRARLASGFINIVAPGLAAGEVARVFLMDMARPGNKVYLAMLLAASRVYGLFATLSILGIALLFTKGHEWPQSWQWLSWGSWALAGTCALPLLMHWRLLRRLVLPFFRWGKQVRRARRIGYMALAAFGAPRQWIGATLLSFVSVAIVLAMFMAIAADLKLPADIVTWSIAMPLVSTASFIPMGFGSFGSQDAAMIAVSQALSLPASGFIAASLVLHAVRLTVALCGALFIDDIRKAVAATAGSRREKTRTAKG